MDLKQRILEARTKNLTLTSGAFGLPPLPEEEDTDLVEKTAQDVQDQKTAQGLKLAQDTGDQEAQDTGDQKTAQGLKAAQDSQDQKAEQNTQDQTAQQDTQDKKAAQHTQDQKAQQDTQDQKAAQDTGDQTAAQDTGDQKAAQDTQDQKEAQDEQTQKTQVHVQGKDGTSSEQLLGAASSMKNGAGSSGGGGGGNGGDRDNSQNNNSEKDTSSSETRQGQPGRNSHHIAEEPVAQDRKTLSEWLRQWVNQEVEKNTDRPAFVFFYRHLRDSPLTLSRREVFILARRFAHRISSLLSRPEGIPGVYVCNTLPISPARIITDLGVLLAGGIPVAGPSDLEEWKKLEAHMNGDVTYCQVMIVAKYSDIDGYLAQRSHSFTENPLRYRVLPVFSPSVEETKSDLLKKLRAMSSLQEMVRTGNDQFKVVFPIPSHEVDSAPSLITYTQRSLLHLAQQLQEVLSLDPDRDIVLNLCDTDDPLGFPLAYLFCGATVALPDKFLRLRPTSDIADDNLGHYHLTSDICIDGGWLARQESVKGIFHSDVLHRLTGCGGISRGEDLKMSRLALCGVVSRSLVDVVAPVASKVSVVYCSKEMGIISHRLFDDEADYVPGDVGVPLEGVRLRFTRPRRPLKEAIPPKPGSLLVQSERLPPRQLLQLGVEGDLWRDIPSVEWWPTQDLAYLDTDEHLHIVGRSRWKVQRSDYKLTVPLVTLEKSLAHRELFEDVVCVDIVVGSPGDVDNPLRSEMVACVKTHRSMWTSDFVTVRDYFHRIQDSTDICSADFAFQMLIFNWLPKHRDGRPKRTLIAHIARKSRARGKNRVYLNALGKPMFHMCQRPARRIIEGVRSARIAALNFFNDLIP